MVILIVPHPLSPVQVVGIAFDLNALFALGGFI